MPAAWISLPELGPLVALLVEHPVDAAIEEAGDLRAGIDPAEAELGVGAHLGRFPGLGHQTLAQAHHHRVVFREVSGEVPKRFGQRVGRDRVGVLLDPVDGGLVLALAFGVAAEEPGAQGGHRVGHDECPLEGLADKGVIGRLAIAEPGSSTSSSQRWKRPRTPRVS